jgi:hypothetical protein
MRRCHLLLTSLATVSALALSGCAAADQEAETPDARTTPAEATPAKPDVTKHERVETEKRIPFERETVKTSSLDKGVTVIKQAGEPGVRVRILRVTIKNGVEAGRKVVRSFVDSPPVTQVKLIGTYVAPKPKPQPASNCDSNYTGACVPVASDVDCAGGDGDGPEYVEGPVQIVGDDVYDLNRDDDSIACDS